LSFAAVDDMFWGLKVPAGALKLCSIVIELLVVPGEVPVGCAEC
jgi:hypothetical protein